MGLVLSNISVIFATLAAKELKLVGLWLLRHTPARVTQSRNGQADNGEQTRQTLAPLALLTLTPHFHFYGLLPSA